MIVVRRDLRMGTGKTAVQVAHASVLGVEKAKSKHRRWFDAWFEEGQAKIAVKVKSLEELMKVKKHAENLDLPIQPGFRPDSTQGDTPRAIGHLGFAGRRSDAAQGDALTRSRLC